MGTTFSWPTRRDRKGTSKRTALCLLIAATLAGPAFSDQAFAAPPPSTPAPSRGVPPPADTATDLATAEKFYGDLDYDHANLVAARILDGKGLSHSELLRALRVLALTDAALGHEDQAREEFIQLLTYSADFQVDPNLGPRVTAPFLEARGYWRSQAEKPGIDVLATVHADGPGTLRVTTRDPSHIVKSGTVGFRWGSSVPYTTAPLTVSGGDGILFEVPERPANVARLDYYAQVLDDHGNAVMEVGNPTSPKSAIVDIPKAAAGSAAGEKKTIFSSPIFWTVAGVIVAGAAATTSYLLLKPKNPSGATLTGKAVCGSFDGTGMAPGACQ
jgi:hypothetical protein